MPTFREELLKDFYETTETARKPPEYALTLTMQAHGPVDLLLHGVIEHVLTGHVGVSYRHAANVIAQAGAEGRAVIRPVTKDVGESLLVNVYECPVSRMCNEFKIALEEL